MSASRPQYWFFGSIERTVEVHTTTALRIHTQQIDGAMALRPNRLLESDRMTRHLKVTANRRVSALTGRIFNSRQSGYRSKRAFPSSIVKVYVEKTPRQS